VQRLIDAGRDAEELTLLMEQEDLKSFSIAEEVINDREPLEAKIATDILHMREKIDLKRGDLVRFAFLDQDASTAEGPCWAPPSCFYDGERVLPAELDENDEYAVVPARFKVPTEFPADYWNKTMFFRESRHGDLCFDVKGVFGEHKAPLVPQALPGSGGAYYATHDYKGSELYFFFETEGCDEAENPEAIVAEMLAKFLATGRCFSASMPGSGINRDEISTALGTAGLPLLDELGIRAYFIP
ncbi:Hypothetical protein POVN_LOCUS628, partial [uncultured virus]